VFDQIVVDLVADIDERWADQLGLMEYGVEDIPDLPDDWDSGNVPLSSLIRGSGATPTRIVLFRRPLEHRASDRAELEAIVLTVLVEQVAELLGIPPADVDPRYPAD
jgi:predicted Zn-dependent protease with MMP-like domain